MSVVQESYSLGNSVVDGVASGVVVLECCPLFASLCFLLLKWKFKSSISPLSSVTGARIGAFVGGAIISIFGFCSSNKQWSKHWSTTISISSLSGHSLLGHGDHHTYKKKTTLLLNTWKGKLTNFYPIDYLNAPRIWMFHDIGLWNNAWYFLLWNHHQRMMKNGIQQ